MNLAIKQTDHLTKQSRAKRRHAGWLFSWLAAMILLAACSAAQAPASEAMPASAPMEDRARMDDSVAQAEGGESGATQNRKIIARATLVLTVDDTQTTVDAITALMEELGGYVSNTNLYRSSYGSGEALQGTLTLRVPAEVLDSTLDRLSALAVSVDSRSLNREDVTDQYTDVDAQIRNLEATETELRAMLEEVRARPNSTSEDIMAVYRTLTDVRGQIEQLRGRKNMWDNLIALSTIDVTLYPDSANLPVVEEGWRPGVVARDAQRALVSAAQVLGNLAIWFVFFFLPLLLVALIPLVVVVWFLRWVFRRFSKPKVQPVVAPPSPPTAPNA